MRACPACGASNGSTDDFCGNCGAYLGWSEPAAQAPSTPSATPPESTAPPEQAPTAPPEPPAPAPAAPPADEPESAPPPRPSSFRARLTGLGRGEPRRLSTTQPADTGSGADTAPAADPGQDEPTNSPPQSGPDEVRTGETTGADEPRRTEDAPPTTPATPPVPTAPPAPSTPTTPPVPPTAPAPPAPSAQSIPRPRTPAASESADPDAIVPVRPAKPVAARPVVRPVAVPDEGAGVPCPVCGTPNLPERRFCRRCAAELRPTAKAAPLPWWRTVWPFRRRVRASSGGMTRFLVILLVVLALCAGGFLLMPAGRALIEDTRDKLGKAKPVTPASTEASASVQGHPAKNTTDGLSNRYWGAPATGASVTYTFRKPFRLVDVIITNGASKEPQKYALQARALQVDLEVTAEDGTTHKKELTLSDKPGDQTIATGYSDVRKVRLVLRSAVGLAQGRHLALAEVEFFQRS
ncbi:NADase-type glycan-binding domain-containing protein [Streptomyces sp. 4N124]|uniref:NADase-type glycan-binding domain-containing protein n=1 Tax=Streptomyces sp. 4N124 TaxID=3457420 RepID=UPI003FCFACE3